MCGHKNPHVALRFNKIAQKKKLNFVKDEEEFMAIAEEVDDNNEEIIESEETKRRTCKTYQRIFNPDYDPENSG